jgi:DNA-binding MarR family transcriptional regulator
METTGTIADSALERLFELAGLLVEGMDHGLGERGITRARAELIWRLRRKGPMTQRALSQALRCTPRNVTSLVDALEASGFVVRRPHPTDRRATLVALTERGEHAAASWQEGYQKLGQILFADLDPAELAHFAATLAAMLQRLYAAAPDADSDLLKHVVETTRDEEERTAPRVRSV